MPTKPKRVCSCRGCTSCQGRCPELTTGGKCRTCKTTTNAGYRNPTHTAVYNSPRWQALRRQVLREQPWCAEPGCTELSHDIDHVIPIGPGVDPFDRSNLQGLCVPHHSAKTAREVLHRD